MASVRFICGTQDLHKELERSVSALPRDRGHDPLLVVLRRQRRLFETLLGDEDAIISDALNHASIIDGIRLCKAERLRYRNSDMADLEAQLQKRPRRAPADDRHRRRLLDGRLPRAARRGSATSPTSTTRWSWSTTRTPSASSATGGRGTPEHFGVPDRVDIMTGTLGKALGGATGGYTSGRPRDRRPPAPAVAAVPVLELGRPGRRRRLAGGARPGRRPRRAARRAGGQHGAVPRAMTEAGFDLLPGDHPIVPVMLRR